MKEPTLKHHQLTMDDLHIVPSTPEQRQNGWDETAYWNTLALPACWDIRPTANIYALGAVHGDVVPVYWDDGCQRGVHWWWLAQKNQTSLGSSLQAPDVWEHLQQLSDLTERTKDWPWTPACEERSTRQWASMEALEKEWSSAPPQGPLVIVPSSHVWSDLGWNRHAPAVLRDEEAQRYIREHVPSVLRRASRNR